MFERMRRLYPRGTANAGVAVDAEGATLGPDCVLVRRTAGGYRSVSREEAAALQEFLFGDSKECDWLLEQCRCISKALGNREIAFAQILGLYVLSNELGAGQLTRLARVGPLIKANFNPDEPRITAGQPGGGQWTGGSSPTRSGPTASPAERTGADEPSIAPAQLTIPWDVPVEIPWDIPPAPTEITPIPFDFPGAERKLRRSRRTLFPAIPNARRNGPQHTTTAAEWSGKENSGPVTPDRERICGAASLGRSPRDVAATQQRERDERRDHP
ncbi:MAG: hypothetical protein JO038_07000 [Alphaproteobacteria bacterium]|nr:hypothetical protein [Alphaproteobacteria bacterium]